METCTVYLHRNNFKEHKQFNLNDVEVTPIPIENIDNHFMGIIKTIKCTGISGIV